MKDAGGKYDAGVCDARTWRRYSSRIKDKERKRKKETQNPLKAVCPRKDRGEWRGEDGRNGRVALIEPPGAAVPARRGRGAKRALLRGSVLLYGASVFPKPVASIPRGPTPAFSRPKAIASRREWRIRLIEDLKYISWLHIDQRPTTNDQQPSSQLGI